jgi:hypothetical protein
MLTLIQIQPEGGLMENHCYLSVQDIVECQLYPFTIGQIRHFLSMRHRNGLVKAVRKLGKRLYLRKDLFDLWIEQQRGG